MTSYERYALRVSREHRPIKEFLRDNHPSIHKETYAYEHDGEEPVTGFDGSYIEPKVRYKWNPKYDRMEKI